MRSPLLLPLFALWLVRAPVAQAGAADRPEVVFERGTGTATSRTDEDADLSADFRYAPPWWQSSIGLPDDWQKTLVSKEGALLYDYPGKFSGFATRVAPSISPGAGAAATQRLDDPRVPIVTHQVTRAGAPRAVWQCFAVVPGDGQDLPRRAAGDGRGARLEATTRTTDLPGWGQPARACVDGFRNIVAGFGCDIGYRFRASPEESYTVVFGLMESYHAETGKRIIDVHVDGAPRRRIDLIADLGRHVPGAYAFESSDLDGDGLVTIDVRSAPGSEDPNPILNMLWVFRGKDVPAPALLVTGRHESTPWIEVDCGVTGVPRASPPGPPRGDLLLIGKPARSEERIEITIDSEEPLELDADDGGVYRGGVRFLSSDPRPESARADGNRLVLIYAPETSEVAAYCASGHEAGDVTIAWARRQLVRAWEYWRSREFPYDRIRVPDPTIQALIDASIRNIYQARERRLDLPVFQVGPTCYRGLWVVDGAFILEAMTFLGQIEDVRAGIEYLLGRAKPDGSFELIRNYWKENGIVLYILYRHAALTGDPGWLAARWEVVRSLVRVIRDLRARSAVDPGALEAGLVPAGFPDGGIGGCVPEYTNVYWSLVGLRSAVRAARLLGRDTPETRGWRSELDDFCRTFRAAAKRDSRTGPDGLPYLPILMREDPKVHPVRGQWGFCHAVYPGELFSADDPLARGTLALLDRHRSEGLVLGTGWMPDGIWNYFASFYGHAHLWMGNGERAAEILYAFAQHAAPLYVWREEQHPQGRGEGLVGDMPHNWASAEFLRLSRNLLVLERGDDLHLLEGIPSQWIRPGAETVLEGIATHFGPLDMRLHVAADGTEARLDVHLRAPGRFPDRLVVHLGRWAAGAPTEIRSREGWSYEIPLRP